MSFPHVFRPCSCYLLLATAFFFAFGDTAISPAHGGPAYDAELAKFDQLRVDRHNYDAVKSLHLYLYNNAVKAIIGHMGRRLYEQMADFEERRLLAACLDKVEDRNELVAPAKCISIARERFLKGRNRTVVGNDSSSISRKGLNYHKEQSAKKGTKENWTRIRKRPTANKQGTKQRKMSPIMDTTSLRQPYSGPSVNSFAPMGRRSRRHANLYEPGFAAKLEIMANTAANEERSPRNVRAQEKLSKAESRPVKNLHKLESLKDCSANKSPISRVADLLRGFLLKKPSLRRNLTKTAAHQAEANDPNWQRTYEILKRVKKELDEKMRMPGAMVAERRMYDLVLGREERSLTPTERASPAAVVNDAIEAISRGAWGSGIHQNQARQGQHRTLSPRFMPIMAKTSPTGTDNNEMLSPTLFALYDDDDDEQEADRSRSIASMPKLLKAVGVSEGDRSKIISTLIDVSGTTQFVDNALSVLKEMNFLSPDVGGPIMDARERMVGAFDTLEASFAPRQRDEFARDGMTFVGADQLEQLFFRDLRVLNFSKADVDLDAIKRFGRMSRRERDATLWATIDHLARNESLLPDAQFGRKRKKRQNSVNEPMVLSPYAFTPTYGLSVLGPLVLSPFIFSPLILNPSVISPFILSPALGAPYILSPYVLGPFILSPFAMLPLILSPYVLSPNILSPYLLSPMVLSPIAVSPNILSPGTLSPVVLSPNVLSPDILGNSTLSDAILSPTFLSR